MEAKEKKNTGTAKLISFKQCFSIIYLIIQGYNSPKWTPQGQFAPKVSSVIDL